MSEQKLPPSMIAHPESGDTVRAEEILLELQEVLKKRGYILSHQPNGIVLGKVPPGIGDQVRVIAVVRMMTPDLIEWAKIDWTPKGVMQPGPWKVQ
jgi:hypothetical protein